jgi:anti-sigma factor RsiW
VLSCRDFLAELSGYLDGDVTASLRADLEAHLAECATCQVIYDSTRKTIRIVTDVGSIEVPREISERILRTTMDRIRSKASPRAPGRPRG